jgi:anti-sigma B factor antagonist
VNINFVERGGSLILVVDGELDLATAPQLDEALTRAQAGGVSELVVDLDQVGFVDSSGLHVLIMHVGRMGENGRRLRLTKGSPQVRRLFELSGVSDRLPFVED